MSSDRWHILTGKEYDRCNQCCEQLSGVDWAKPLLKAIKANGGLLSSNARPLLYELRFASELQNASISPEYEVLAGVDRDRIDFRLSDPNWLIELVAIDETANLAEMTKSEIISADGDAGVTARFLEIRSDAKDPRHTGGWQMIKLQEKIYAKVLKNESFHKFPIPTHGVTQAILIDARGFDGGSGPDEHHLNQLVYGARYAHDIFYETFNGTVVNGVFDDLNSTLEARTIGERIHCLIFTNEREFGSGTMWTNAFAYWNPFIDFNAQETSKSFPFPLQHRFRATAKT